MKTEINILPNELIEFILAYKCAYGEDEYVPQEIRMSARYRLNEILPIVYDFAKLVVELPLPKKFTK